MRSFNDQLMRHYRKLLFFALKLTQNRDEAEELRQETCLRALNGQDTFEPGTNMGAWLNRIMKNVFIDSKRRNGRRANRTIVDDSSADAEVEAAQFHTVALRETMRTVAHLVPHQRKTLLLAVFNDSDYRGIAAETGIAIGTVKSRVSRARSILQKQRELDELD